MNRRTGTRRSYRHSNTTAPNGVTSPLVGPYTGPRTTRGAVAVAAVALGVVLAAAFPLVAAGVVGVGVVALTVRTFARLRAARRRGLDDSTGRSAAASTPTDRETDERARRCEPAD